MKGAVVPTAPFAFAPIVDLRMNCDPSRSGVGKEHGMKKRLFAVVAAWVLIVLPATAQDFPAFKEEPINAPGSYRQVADPTGQAPAKKVHSFTILPGKGSDRKYTDGNSDGSFSSVRSQRYKAISKQPDEAWYAWDKQIPKGFPAGRRPTSARFHSFAYWHNGGCPNLALVSKTASGSTLALQTDTFEGRDCRPAQRLPIADLRALRGGWHRGGVHVVWSKGAEVWLDGKPRTALKGRNITAGALAKNYYLCCTKGTALIAPATMYSTTPVRAASREGLR